MSEPDSNPTLREHVGRLAKLIAWWVEYDRSRPATIDRENYLRGLMGLPPVCGRRDDEGRL
jgi:hypothetical protein